MKYKYVFRVSLANPSNGKEENWIKDAYTSMKSQKYTVGYTVHQSTDQTNLKLLEQMEKNIIHREDHTLNHKRQSIHNFIRYHIRAQRTYIICQNKHDTSQKI